MEGRKRRYLLIMGSCLVLCAAAWVVGSQWSRPVGVVLAVIAAGLPPVAVMVANLGWEDRMRGQADDDEEDG